MQNVFTVLILLAVAAVSVTLGFGIYSLFRGGDYARSHSNRLMRLRIVLQAVAVILLMTGLWWKTSHGG
ncbi:MAG: high-affinity Fe2+/Pb2+ permease [Brevundimonas sp.]|jgi:high-affinity Fe2+/Pb2+ permease|uniref:twin transmembrane helix small protein n=1 Tax=Brevundimonas sp. TaxID=1871086 RepID=UPI002487A07F|nr:twin transmembrane helix small protein [Brevundimonas sp.]MDI1281403.1 twin transmembrane helix small protein [Brevundimonas sp.]